MHVRPRLAGDVHACVEILRRTHEIDGYPLVWPDVPERFVVRAHETDAWVAVIDDAVVGHVSNQVAEGWPGLPAVTSETVLGADQLSVVSALFTSVDHRRSGVGNALLDQAVQRATATGHHPVLDVGKTLTGAVSFYERAGWCRIGEVTFMIGSTSIDSWVYVGPRGDDDPVTAAWR